MNSDTQSAAPVASGTAENTDDQSLFSGRAIPSLPLAASHGQKGIEPMEETRETMNPLLVTAAALIEHCTRLHDDDVSQHASEAWYEEAPTLQGPAFWPEGCAALCMASFGKQMVPEVDQDKYGTDSQTALQLARVYLAAPPNSPVREAFETLAVVAQRQQGGNSSLSTD